MKYIIYFYDGGKMEIEEERGIKLQQLLISENLPKFIKIDDEVFATNQIVRVAPDYEGSGKFPALSEAPMTEEQKANREKVLEEMRKKWKNS